MSETAIDDEGRSISPQVNGENSSNDIEQEKNISSCKEEKEECEPEQTNSSSDMASLKHDKEEALGKDEQEALDEENGEVVSMATPPPPVTADGSHQSPVASSNSPSNSSSPVLVHSHPLLEQTDDGSQSSLTDTPPVSPPSESSLGSGLFRTQTNEGVFFSGINYLGSSTVDAPVSETEANRKMSILKTQAGEPVPIILQIPPDNTGNIMFKDPASNQILTAFSIRHVLFCARGDTSTEINDCLALNVIHKRSGVYHCHVFQCQISEAVRNHLIHACITVILSFSRFFYSVKKSFMQLVKPSNKRYYMVTLSLSYSMQSLINP